MIICKSFKYVKNFIFNKLKFIHLIYLIFLISILYVFINKFETKNIYSSIGQYYWIDNPPSTNYPNEKSPTCYKGIKNPKKSLLLVIDEAKFNKQFQDCSNLEYFKFIRFQTYFPEMFAHIVNSEKCDSLPISKEFNRLIDIKEEYQFNPIENHNILYEIYKNDEFSINQTDIASYFVGTLNSEYRVCVVFIDEVKMRRTRSIASDKLNYLYASCKYDETIRVKANIQKSHFESDASLDSLI